MILENALTVKQAKGNEIYNNIYLHNNYYCWLRYRKPDIKNLILTKNIKTYEEVIFKDKNQKNIEIANYKGKVIILNFWAYILFINQCY